MCRMHLSQQGLNTMHADLYIHVYMYMFTKTLKYAQMMFSKGHLELGGVKEGVRYCTQGQ